MDRILFIIPPHVKFDDFVNPSFNARVEERAKGRFGSVLTDMPLGPMALSAYVKKHIDVDIRLLDFNVLLNKVQSFEYTCFADYFRDVLAAPEWADFQPTIVGITVLFTPSYFNFIDITHCSREAFPDALILAGGGVPTTMPKEIFRDSKTIDALCYGEGEKPFLGLLQADDKRQHLEQVPSWMTRSKFKLQVNGQGAFANDWIQDLDEIPFNDYSIVKTEDYSLNPALTAYAGVYEKKQNFHYMTSRGCVYRCTFCASYRVNGRKMRYHSVARVREDLTILKERFGARTIVFQDDHFMGDTDRALEIVNIVGELELTAVFQNSLTLFALKRPMLEALRKAGVSQLLLSVESGSARVLREIMHKPLTLPIVEQVARDCRDLGIYTDCNILIGLPGETKEDIADTRAFLKTISANWFKIFIATPLVGSEMFDIAVEKGYLHGDYVDFDYKKANLETEDFSLEYIQKMQYQMNLELNFVNNADLRLGQYRTALLGFLNAIKAKPNHAFGHHYAAICYEQLGEAEKARHHRGMAQTAARDPFWHEYMEMFQVEIGETSVTA
jgi:radical SAM superfamily enzyme YgiQ (UPF0313 family)